MDRFGVWAWQQLRDTFSHSGVKGVKVSVEETESVQLQSSVRPFFPENSAYDLQCGAEAVGDSQHVSHSELERGVGQSWRIFVTFVSFCWWLLVIRVVFHLQIYIMGLEEAPR
ncbi:hypothetical protein Q7C36_023603 [Tachysurus vachellii]|uniref:Uncharacterized protein n=1 Tax=Tachysurus vachellii TaxID=175792 RepID=A0AA88LGN7_TACVA|nr:hypothetical protein Q7C36_023603 [Tachysurus vachellii]